MDGGLHHDFGLNQIEDVPRPSADGRRDVPPVLGSTGKRFERRGGTSRSGSWRASSPGKGCRGGHRREIRQDRSARLAAGIAFWAFFAVFPLLLVLVSLLGFFLPDSTRSEVMHNVAALFPLIDPDNVGGLTGSVWSIVAGTATALWSGTQLMRSAEFAFNSAWEIPAVERPRIAEQMKRALLALSTIGLGLVVSALLSGLVTGRSSDVHLGAAGKGLGYVVSAILDVGLFLLAFRILTDRRITFRQVLPGAVLSGMSFWLLELVSSLVISRRLQDAQPTYGHFATVITILWWFYLQALITLLGSQLNVVLHLRSGERG